MPKNKPYTQDELDFFKAMDIQPIQERMPHPIDSDVAAASQVMQDARQGRLPSQQVQPHPVDADVAAASQIMQDARQGRLPSQQPTQAPIRNVGGQQLSPGLPRGGVDVESQDVRNYLETMKRKTQPRVDVQVGQPQVEPRIGVQVGRPQMEMEVPGLQFAVTKPVKREKPKSSDEAFARLMEKQQVRRAADNAVGQFMQYSNIAGANVRAPGVIPATMLGYDQPNEAGQQPIGVNLADLSPALREQVFSRLSLDEQEDLLDMWEMTQGGRG